MGIEDDFFLTNLELRESTETGELASGLSHASMKGMVLLTVLELAARGVPKGAVTVLHDAGDTGERYRALASDLAERGFAVALPDLRGHGRTEGDRGHSNGLAEIERDIQEIQDHLAYRMPDDRKILIGVGLGANYAASFAVRHPEVLFALVLLSPLHDPNFVAPPEPRGLGKLFKKVTPRSEGSTGYSADALTSRPGQATAWSANELTHEVITVRAIEEARRSAALDLPKVGTLGLPVLLLHGEDDELASVERTRALAGGTVDVQTFEGQRHHLLHDGRSADVRAKIAEWLSAKMDA